jgi:hypothetical protein
MRTGHVLAGLNLAGCILFVLLRDPAPPAFLAEVDAARQACKSTAAAHGWCVGIYSVSGIDGTIACRLLHSWSEWHGGERLGVKILEAVNVPALVATVVVHLEGEIFGVSRRLTACGWSWVLAVVFVVVSTAQWLVVGWFIDGAWARVRR